MTIEQVSNMFITHCMHFFVLLFCYYWQIDHYLIVTFSDGDMNAGQKVNKC